MCSTSIAHVFSLRMIYTLCVSFPFQCALHGQKFGSIGFAKKLTYTFRSHGFVHSAICPLYLTRLHRLFVCSFVRLVRENFRDVVLHRLFRNANADSVVVMTATAAIATATYHLTHHYNDMTPILDTHALWIARESYVLRSRFTHYAPFYAHK